jgi:hypothetical protein
MSQFSVNEQIAQGYEAPRNTQFSAFLDNRCGKLLELVEIFDGHAVNMVALSVIDSADHAVVRLVTSRSDLARRLLQRHQIPFSEAEILVVELSAGQTLSKLCISLLSAELNIHYAYPLMVRPHGVPTIAIHTDDQVLAGQILRRKMFTLLGENDLGDNATQGDPPGMSPN